MTLFPTLVNLLLIPLPRRLTNRILNRLFHWRIHPTARIGMSILRVGTLEMEEGSRIGHFNVLKDLSSLRMSFGSSIGQWNWMSASQPLVDHFGQQSGFLKLGTQSAITSRHYLDCSGGVSIGKFTTLGGVKSTILSHQIDMDTASQTLKSISIGDYCFNCSDVRFTPGSQVTDRCVIAMGAVVAGNLVESEKLYGGVPAKVIKSLESAKYFQREQGWIGPQGPANRPDTSEKQSSKPGIGRLDNR